MSDITVLIDARNVQRSQWPNLSDEELVERTRNWAEQNDKRLVLVFDGRAPGGIVGATELDERTTLVGSRGESADDWLIREAPHYPGPGSSPRTGRCARPQGARPSA